VLFISGLIAYFGKRFLDFKLQENHAEKERQFQAVQLEREHQLKEAQLEKERLEKRRIDRIDKMSFVMFDESRQDYNRVYAYLEYCYLGGNGESKPRFEREFLNRHASAASLVAEQTGVLREYRQHIQDEYGVVVKEIDPLP
jgi:hypothetical protein